MLHGNLLLHGWTLTDVSFTTVSLPEYMLVELVVVPTVVHTAAFTYTLLVPWGLPELVKGAGPQAGEGVLRVLIGSSTALAPQVGNPVLLGVPDHVGTGVPILADLVLDCAPRRCMRPVIVLMLAWATIGDRLVIAPHPPAGGHVCAIRIWWWCWLASRWRRCGSRSADRGGHRLGGHRAAGRADARAPRRVRAHPARHAPGQVVGAARHFRLTGEGLLGLYGADFSHLLQLGLQTAIAAAHLAGLALAVWALGRALRRFFRCDDLLVQVLALGILADLAAFAFSSLPRTSWDTRQISAVLPFGAAAASTASRQT